MPDPAPDAPLAAPAQPDYAGLLPMALYVKGSVVRGTMVQLVRAGPSGETKDLWLVRVGTKMVTASGQLLDAHPWPNIRPQIQRQVGHTFEAALRLAQGIKV